MAPTQAVRVRARLDRLAAVLGRLALTTDDLVRTDGASLGRLRGLRLLTTDAIHTMREVEDVFDGTRWGLCFESGLRTFVAEYGELTGTAAHVRVDGALDGLPADLAGAFRSVVTEALRSLEPNARATVLLLVLAVGDAAAILDIVDDGVDLRRRRAPACRPDVDIALRGMRRTMAAVGGTLSLHPLSPRGVRLRASAPVLPRRCR